MAEDEHEAAVDQWLKDFAKSVGHAQDEINNVFSRENGLNAVRQELARQDEKWGLQNHPDISVLDPEKTAEETADYLKDYEEQAAFYKSLNDQIVKDGKIGWDTILLEEVYEALEESDPDKLKVELVQVAAVALAWVAAIERR